MENDEWCDRNVIKEKMIYDSNNLFLFTCRIIQHAQKIYLLRAIHNPEKPIILTSIASEMHRRKELNVYQLLSFDPSHG